MPARVPINENAGTEAVETRIGKPLRRNVRIDTIRVETYLARERPLRAGDHFQVAAQPAEADSTFSVNSDNPISENPAIAVTKQSRVEGSDGSLHGQIHPALGEQLFSAKDDAF